MADENRPADASGSTGPTGAVEGGYFFPADIGETASTDVASDRPGIVGNRMVVGKRRIPAGATIEAHTHPEEQFSFVEQGRLRSSVGGDEETVTEGDLIYTPAEAVHLLDVLGDEAVLYYISPRTGFDLTPDPSLNAELKKPVLVAGDDGYHFDLDELTRTIASTGHGTSKGFYIEGELVQVGRLMYPEGGGPPLHSHPNEMFNYCLAGSGTFTVDGDDFDVGPGEISHIPPGIDHRVRASEGGFHWLAAKDKSYRMYGEALE
ncbi:MAG: cupin domain-containing protein [Halobacteriales archaeon]|nr:cupin domain-containing protein [Halobacteriales archaeon]